MNEKNPSQNDNIKTLNLLLKHTVLRVVVPIALFFSPFFISSALGVSTNTTDTLTSDGAWCWFGDPRAIYYHGIKEQTYMGWITSEGNIMVSSYDHKTGVLQKKLIHAGLQVDDHDNPTIFFRKDGRVIVFYSKHTEGPMYRVISDNPEDIASFGEPVTFGENVTYPNPFQVGDTIYLFYRGINWHPTLIKSFDDGETWNTPQQFIQGGGARPYTKYTQDNEGGIHVASTTGHPRDELNNKIFYTYFKNGVFRKADGSVVKSFTGSSSALDIDLGEAETVYDASLGKGWIWDIAVDKDNYPVMVYAAFPTDLEHHYYYAYWDGNTWKDNHITTGGQWFPQTPSGSTEPEPNYSGGIALDHNNICRVYLSKPVNGVFEIWKFTTNDSGASWDSLQVTQNTPSELLNVRPYVPLNHKNGYFDVLWMQGTYLHYTNYHTGILYQSPGEYFKHFDFGTENSPVDAGAVKVSNLTSYNSEYGFLDISNLYAFNNDTGNAATRDYVYSSKAVTFKASLFNGDYQVKVIQGGDSIIHDNMSVYANDIEVIADQDVAAGEWIDNSFDVVIENNNLMLEFFDNGGSDTTWILNAIEISAKEIFADSLSLSKDTIEIYEGSSEILEASIFPVSATNKTVTWFSENKNIATVIDGTVTAIGEGVTYIVVKAKEGLLTDSCKVVVNKPNYVSEAFFDFGTSDSPVAIGALPVTEQTLLENSYGWLTIGGLSSRDRGGSTDSRRDFVFSSSSHIFQVYVKNGLYHITTEQGDLSYSHDNMSLYVNGELKTSGISISTGEFMASEFDVLTKDKKIVFEFVDNGGSDANWVINSIEIRKKILLDSIRLSPNPLYLLVGNKDTLDVAYYPVSVTDTSVSWKSTDELVATVSDGEVQALTEGTTYIVAFGLDGSGQKDSCKVVVKEPISAQLELPEGQIHIFPNPCPLPSFFVNIPFVHEDFLLSLTDNMGRLILTKQFSNEGKTISFRFDGSSIESGLYHVLLVGHDFTYHENIVIIRQ